MTHIITVIDFLSYFVSFFPLLLRRRLFGVVVEDALRPIQ